MLGVRIAVATVEKNGQLAVASKYSIIFLMKTIIIGSIEMIMARRSHLIIAPFLQ
jgi:hypothetical protein